MLMSIGYELRIDTIKNHTEIPNHLSLEDLFLKIYQSMNFLIEIIILKIVKRCIKN